MRSGAGYSHQNIAEFSDYERARDRYKRQTFSPKMAFIVHNTHEQIHTYTESMYWVAPFSKSILCKFDENLSYFTICLFHLFLLDFKLKTSPTLNRKVIFIPINIDLSFDFGCLYRSGI